MDHPKSINLISFGPIEKRWNIFLCKTWRPVEYGSGSKQLIQHIWLARRPTWTLEGLNIRLTFAINGQKVHHFSLNYLLFIDHFLLRGVLITHNFTYVHIHAQKTTIIMNWFSIVFCMYVCTYCETVWATSFNLSLKPNIYVYRIEAPQV